MKRETATRIIGGAAALVAFTPLAVVVWLLFGPDVGLPLAMGAVGGVLLSVCHDRNDTP